jgi:hypothetical protein
MENHIRMNVTEIRRENTNWIHLVEDRVRFEASVNMVMNLRVP